MKKIIIKLISALFPTRHLRRKIRALLNEEFNNSNFIGQNNKIILVSDFGEKIVDSIENVNISISGNNNTIRVPENHKLSGNINITTNDCLIDIQSKNFVKLNLSTHDSSGQKLIIGSGTTIFDASIFLNERNATVLIGKNCLFSGNIVIWATDGHAIIEQKTEKILNHIQTTRIIEDNAWVGGGVIMTKNAHIPSKSIVGAGSVVTNVFEQKNVIIAGNPAKVIKEGVNWNHSTASRLEETRLKGDK